MIFDEALPAWLTIGLSAGFGLLIGSFLNVVIWRVPRGESIVSPPSACPSCGHAIRRRDNVPVMSWLILRGRCRDCAAPISPRYPLVESLTAVAFGLVAVRFGGSWVLLAFLYLAAITIALGLIDIDTRRLPNAIVLPSYVVGAVLLGGAALAAGDPGRLVRIGIGAAALWVFYFLLKLAYPPGMGFGDVKLAGVLGMYLSYVGWGSLVVGAFAAFLIGGLYSVGLLIARRATRKSAVPFGPWMLLGAWVGIAFGEGLWRAYLDVVL